MNLNAVYLTHFLLLIILILLHISFSLFHVVEIDIQLGDKFFGTKKIPSFW